MPRRYKPQKAPPQTEKERRVVRYKQRVDQADNSYLKHARPLLAASLLAVLIPGLLGWALGHLPNLLPGLPETALTRLGFQALALGLAIVLGPVTLLGFAGLCLRAWRGRKCPFSQLFAYCGRGRLAAAWAFSAVFLPIPALFGLLSALLPAQWLPGLAVRLGLGALTLWLLLRLLPAPLLYILQPQKPLTTLRAAWALTAGQLVSMAGYGLRLLLRVGAGLALYLLLMLALFMLPLSGTLVLILATLARYLILALMAPLLWIGAVGYMDSWLPSDSQVRRRGGQNDA